MKCYICQNYTDDEFYASCNADWNMVSYEVQKQIGAYRKLNK